MGRNEQLNFSQQERDSAIFLIFQKILTATGAKKFSLSYLRALSNTRIQVLFESIPTTKKDIKILKKDMRIAKAIRNQRRFDRLREHELEQK